MISVMTIIDGTCDEAVSNIGSAIAALHDKDVVRWYIGLLGKDVHIDVAQEFPDIHVAAVNYHQLEQYEIYNDLMERWIGEDSDIICKYDQRVHMNTQGWDQIAMMMIKAAPRAGLFAANTEDRDLCEVVPGLDYAARFKVGNIHASGQPVPVDLAPGPMPIRGELLFIPRRTFNIVGYFSGGYEDPEAYVSDYCWRIAMTGLFKGYVPGLSVTCPVEGVTENVRAKYDNDFVQRIENRYGDFYVGYGA